METNILNIERLIECRKRLGITKQEAAKRVGVSQPAYLRYEAGDRTPSIQVIKEIAKVFQTSVEYLTGQTDSASSNSYVVTEADHPELFWLVKHYFDTDEAQAKRILAYINKLQKEEKSI